MTCHTQGAAGTADASTHVPVARACVLGSGSWGTAAAGLLAQNAGHVCVYARRDDVAAAIDRTHANPAHLRDYTLPANVGATSDMAACLCGAGAVVVAVPSAYLASTLAAAAPLLAEDVPVCLLTKGVDERGVTLAHAADALLGGAARAAGSRVAVLSGPNHAEEIAAGQLSAAVIASTNPQVAATFQQLFASVDFRAYATGDVVGVSLCGAMKNVVAIASGVAVGLGAGDNTLAVLMTRGLAEMGRMVAACGGDPKTCMGLAGMGDLVATCTSPHSRNRAFGIAFAHGTSLAAYEADTHMVVEGAAAAGGIVRLAAARGVEVPIARAVNAILHEGASVADAVSSLLTRIPREEFYGFSPTEWSHADAI